MKLAIIGSGISGLGIAYLLHKHHDITIYEKNDYIGGHSRTVDVNIQGKIIPVDTGFIVFNERNYPYLTGLFKHLGVRVEKSDMSFGVSIDNGWLEYGTRKPLDMFAQKKNIFKPQFWKMLADILKFNASARNYLESDLTLGSCLQELNLGEWFKNYYLLAMGASIWSMPTQQMLDFPARSFIRFFDNHNLLSLSNHHQWYTVRGGSKEYVAQLTASFHEKIHLNCGVTKVARDTDGVTITDTQGNTQHYDQVIFACHSNQILTMLDNPTHNERYIISAIHYQPNEMILHSDISFMQKQKKAWSSWVYLSQKQDNNNNAISLSYWMNNLQPLDTDIPIIITLNPAMHPASDKIYDKFTFHHPVFDTKAVVAQEKLDIIQGVDRIWYTGAWQRYGFHEDGLLSAVNVALKMGIKIPWV